MKNYTFDEFLEKLDNQRGKEYINLIKEIQAKNRGLVREQGYELHHIHPRGLGGVDSDSNLVKLTTFEHCTVHALLAMAFPCSETLQPVSFMSGRQCNTLEEVEKASLEDIYCWSDLRAKASEAKKGQPSPLRGISFTKEHIDKIQNTFLERYGVRNNFEREGIREKARQTKMERYGNGMGPAYLYSQQVQLEKYGKVNGGCLTEDANEKRRKTNLDKYGVTSCIYLESSKQKSLATRIERYGFPMGKAGREEYFDKRNETKLRKYGVKDCRCLPEVQERAAATRLAKYGDTAGLLHTKESQEKSKKSRTVTYAKKKTIVRSDEFKVWFEPVRDRYRRNKDAVKDFLKETGRTYDDYELYTED